MTHESRKRETPITVRSMLGERWRSGCAAGADAGTLFDAVEALRPKLRVTTSGATLKSNPPFALATAPKVELDEGTLALEVVQALRYTAEDIAAASPDTQYQLMVALQAKFAGKREQIEKAAGLKKLGLTLPVSLVHPPANGETGYFGSPAHQKQLRMFPDQR